jgi:hypothetical protein
MKWRPVLRFIVTLFCFISFCNAPLVCLNAVSKKERIHAPKAISNSSTVEKVKIFSTKIERQENFNSLDALCVNWISKCKEKLNSKKKAHLPNHLKQTLQDCQLVLHDIQLVKHLGKYSIYIAYDSEKKIQGIALSEKDPLQNAAHITYLTTSPDNIPLHVQDKKVRGVGTVLLLHIIRDMRKAGYLCVSVKSLPSAIGFYEKCGFVAKQSVFIAGRFAPSGKGIVLTNMFLTFDKAISFIETHKNQISSPTNKEPFLTVS